MNKEELVFALDDLARHGILGEAELDSHVCTIAIRAINQCFEDIDMLLGYIEGEELEIPSLPASGYRGKPTHPYNPEWEVL